MSRILDKTVEKINQHESATGEWFAVNALARITVAGNLGILIWEMTQDMPVDAAIVPGALFAAGCLVSTLTHRDKKHHKEPATSLEQQRSIC